MGRRIAEDSTQLRDYATAPVLPFGGRALLLSICRASKEMGRALGYGSRCLVFATGPGMPGRLSSVVFEVQPDSGNNVTRSPTTGEAPCTGPSDQMPHLLPQSAP